MKGVLSGTVVSIMVLLATDIGWAAWIQSAGPSHVWAGRLVVIYGTSFGSAPGASSPRRVSLAPIVGGPSGNFEPASPGCRVPIVDWRESRIVILVARCDPGEYRLAIWGRHRESNEVPLTVQEPPPPALPADRPLGTAMIVHVHPELASPGQFIDLYGDFANPDPSHDQVILVPSDDVKQQNPDIQKQWVLQPLPGELARQHMRVRLPTDGLAVGEFLLIPTKRGGRSGFGQRIVVRSTEPAEWESRSQFRNVVAAPFRLAFVMKNVGMGAEELDILGLNFGSMQGPRGVHLMRKQDLDNLEWNIRHKDDPQAPLYGIPSPLPVTKWSDTRIRIRNSGPSPSGDFFVIMSGPSEAWSNPVHVRFP